MAETELEPKIAHVGTETTIPPTAHQYDVVRPPGWMYKRLGRLGWYASPKFQLGMVAFVCFMCPGMFNALGGLGGGGNSDLGLADDMVRFEILRFSYLFNSQDANRDYRTQPSTVPLPLSVSLPVPSSTAWVFALPSLLVVSVTAYTPSAFSSPFTNMSPALISSLVPFWVSALVCCGLLRVPS